MYKIINYLFVSYSFINLYMATTFRPLVPSLLPLALGLLLSLLLLLLLLLLVFASK